jgi:hypothetical protein
MRRYERIIFLLALAAALTACGTARLNEQAKKTETAEVRVSEIEEDGAEPAVAASADGSLFVVYVRHGKDKSADIFLRKFDRDLKPVGEKVRINPEEGQATAWYGDPPTIAIDESGTIYVGWTARVKTEAGSGTDLFLSVSRDDGLSFEAPVRVNDDSAPASHGMHSLAVDPSGRVFLAWLDERNLKREESGASHHAANEAAEPNSEVFFAVSTDGGRSFSPNVKLASEVCPCCKTALAVAPDGKIFAAWRQVLPGDFRHIAIASTADGGASFTEPVIVSDDRWQINACPVSGAALSFDSKNALRVAWYTAGEAGQPGLYTSASEDGGKTFAPRLFIREGSVSGTPRMLTDAENRIRLVWSAGEKIFTGSVFGANKTDSDEELSAGNFPAIAKSNERFFAAYVKNEKNTRSVRIRKLDFGF